MDDLILIGIMVLIAGIGSYIVKLIVPFQTRLWEESYGRENSIGVRIAFEHSEDCAALRNIFEETFFYISCKRMEFFYGSEEQIRNGMKDGKIDIAFLDTFGRIRTEEHICYRTVYLKEQILEYQDDRIRIRPLTSQKRERMMIWKKSGKSDIDIFVQAVIADNGKDI